MHLYIYIYIYISMATTSGRCTLKLRTKTLSDSIAFNVPINTSWKTCHFSWRFCLSRGNILFSLVKFNLYFILLYDSLFRPKLAVVAGFVRLLGLIAYVEGYASGEPGRRFYGSFGTTLWFTRLLTWNIIFEFD